jgi:hypothetical protein
LSEIKLRLRAFFSSRFIIVDAGQSPGASLVIAAEVSGTVFFGAVVAVLGPVALVAALAAAAVPFFLTILASFFGNCGALYAAAVRAQCELQGQKKKKRMAGRERGVKSATLL